MRYPADGPSMARPARRADTEYPGSGRAACRHCFSLQLGMLSLPILVTVARLPYSSTTDTIPSDRQARPTRIRPCHNAVAARLSMMSRQGTSMTRRRGRERPLLTFAESLASVMQRCFVYCPGGAVLSQATRAIETMVAARASSPRKPAPMFAPSVGTVRSIRIVGTQRATATTHQTRPAMPTRRLRGCSLDGGVGGYEVIRTG
jgi:hypothetical protein